MNFAKINGIYIPVSSWHLETNFPDGFADSAEKFKSSIVESLGIPVNFCGTTYVSNYASAQCAQWDAEAKAAGGWAKYLLQVQRNLKRGLYATSAAPAIAERLPDDFVQGRDKLAKALAESEFDFQERLNEWAKKHRVPVR